LPRNGWTESIGMGGRLRPELPAGITRNTQFFKPLVYVSELWGKSLEFYGKNKGSKAIFNGNERARVLII